MKKIVLFYLLAVMVITLAAQEDINNFNCSTIIVGKDASKTGSVLIGHNEDDGGTQLINYLKADSEDHDGNSLMSLRNGAEIKQVSHTFGYLWLEMPGQSFADCFLNENGVLVTSNSCPSIETFGEIVDGGIGYFLRVIIAQRAESARHGVELAGKLISKVGYNAAGRTYTIADQNEAWILSVVRGKHWVAQRVQDDHVLFLPNYYIIKHVDLDDNKNFLASQGLIEYAEKRGWYNAEEGDFNFREVYGNKRSASSMSNIGRMWIGVRSLELKEYDIEDDFPTTFKPAYKIGKQEIMEVLSNHYEGTHLDYSEDDKNGSPHSNKTMSICAVHQQISYIAELRGGMAPEIGCVIWTAPRRGCVNPYIPVYLGVTKLPEYLSIYSAEETALRHFDVDKQIYERNNDKAWWSFVEVAEYVDEHYENRINKRVNIKNDLQSQFFIRFEEVDKEIMDTWKSDRKRSETIINNFTREVFDLALKSNREYLK